MQKNILYEDEDIMVVFKPAGIATQTARIGQQDMVSELKNYLAGKGQHQGEKEPYLGLVHRLDQPVSGLLAFGKSKRGAAGLSRLVTEGKLQKYYYAVVLGRMKEEKGTLCDYLYKDSRTNQSVIVSEDFKGAKEAVLEYEQLSTLAVFGDGRESVKKLPEVSLVRIRLLTGRHHQIRVQFANAGYPLLGDNKYGNDASRDLSAKAGCKSIALCAYRLDFDHPVTGKKMSFEKKPEDPVFVPFFTL